MHTTSPPRPVAPRRSGSSTSASRPTRALSAPRAASLSWRRPACGATELRSSSAGSTTSSASSSPPEVTAIRRGAFITAAVGLLLLVGCARSPAPEDVAVEYGRALYRYDAAAIYRLASAADRRAKGDRPSPGRRAHRLRAGHHPTPGAVHGGEARRHAPLGEPRNREPQAHAAGRQRAGDPDAYAQLG